VVFLGVMRVIEVDLFFHAALCFYTPTQPPRIELSSSGRARRENEIVFVDINVPPLLRLK